MGIAFCAISGLTFRWLPEGPGPAHLPSGCCSRAQSSSSVGRCWETAADPPASPSACVSHSETTPCSLFPGCVAQRNFCDGTWCQNGGTCVSRWNTYLCECPLRFGGKNCEQGECLAWTRCRQVLGVWDPSCGAPCPGPAASGGPCPPRHGGSGSTHRAWAGVRG